MIFPGQRHRREECDHHGHRHPLEEDLQVTHLDEFPRVVVIRRAAIGGKYLENRKWCRENQNTKCTTKQNAHCTWEYLKVK